MLGNFKIPHDSIKAVLYTELYQKREFSSNACRKFMTRTIKNPQDEIRAQIVLKLTNKTEIETNSRIDV